MPWVYFDHLQVKDSKGSEFRLEGRPVTSRSGVGGRDRGGVTGKEVEEQKVVEWIESRDRSRREEKRTGDSQPTSEQVK